MSMIVGLMAAGAPIAAVSIAEVLRARKKGAVPKIKTSDRKAEGLRKMEQLMNEVRNLQLTDESVYEAWKLWAGTTYDGLTLDTLEGEAPWPSDPSEANRLLWTADAMIDKAYEMRSAAMDW